MTTVSLDRTNLAAALFALAGVMCFSVNDFGFKFLSDRYALHQIVFVRSCIGLIALFICVPVFFGNFPVLRTRRPVMHLLRGLCVVFANMCMFLGLAALPIADATAVFFVSPLVITVFSVIFLREAVGLRRWGAVAVGFLGVLVIVQPGTAAFQVAMLLPIGAAVLYATLNILTRKIGGTEGAITMGFYTQLTFLVASGLFGLALGHGAYAGQSHPSLEFLLRPWGRLLPADYPILLMLGVCSTLGGIFLSQAYRISNAAFVAPFEYASMPMAIIWGITVFGTWPGQSAWVGIALIVGSGLFLLWRETQRGRPKPPIYRR